MSFLTPKGFNRDISQVKAKVHVEENIAEDYLKETGQYVLFGTTMGVLVLVPFVNSMVQKIPDAIALISKVIP